MYNINKSNEIFVIMEDLAIRMNFLNVDTIVFSNIQKDKLCLERIEKDPDEKGLNKKIME